MSRLFIILGVVTFGFSQIMFNLVQNNLEWFYGDYLFFSWIVLWVQVIPFVILFGLDTFFRNRPIGTGWLCTWDTFLYTLLSLSLLRQFQVLHNSTYQRSLGILPALVVYFLLGAVVLLLSLKSRRIVPLFLCFLGVLSFFLTASFLHGTGEFLSVWKKPGNTSVRSNNQKTTPVFLIVFDELSYDSLVKNGNLDREAFPNFARMAMEGVWFTNATTNHWGTIHALPTLLTGRLSTDSHPPTLFETLGEKYHGNVVVTEMGVERWMRIGKSIDQPTRYRGKAYFLRSNPLLCAQYIFQLLLDSGFFSLTHPAKQVPFSSAYHLTFPMEMNAYLQTIDSQNSIGQISLWHLSIPHSPFVYSADGDVQEKRNMNFPFPDDYNPQDFDYIWRNYLDQVRYADRILGILLDRIELKKLSDSSIIIVTSDHGIRIWGDIYNHLDLIAHVPLIIRGPGIKPATYDWDIQQFDIVPTILGLLNQSFPASAFDGVSAFSVERPIRRKTLCLEGGNMKPKLFALDPITNSWKLFGEQTESPKTKPGLISALSNSVNPMQAKDSFSAVIVINDLMMAREEHKNFLTLYLRKSFPKSVSESQLKSLRIAIQELEKLPDTPSHSFKRGMFYFFQALSETQWLAYEKSQDPILVDQHWKLAIEYFKKSKLLGAEIEKEITKIFHEADANSDGSLNIEELRSIIKNRSSEIS